jgi:hypothetical protein
MNRVLLIALDSVGIDPLGHDRPESVYARSRFLFPRGRRGELLSLPDSPVPGALVETAVVGDDHRGAIECAITYTSIFSGTSAVERHGLMHGLGLKESVLQEMIRADNLFRRFADPCLANAIFPFHFPFLGTSYVQDRMPERDREAVEEVLTFDDRRVRLRGSDKHGFAELFTLAEINQNIFVYAAREAGVPLRTWADVRAGRTLTGTMTNELESRLNWDALGEEPLPVRTPEEAAAILAALANRHDFTFYKYQMADLVSHTGRVDLARDVFATIERFVEAVLLSIDQAETVVIVTSDHGHLEQVAYSHGHPKARVPTWYFGSNAETHAARMRRPEGIFHVVAPRREPQPV